MPLWAFTSALSDNRWCVVTAPSSPLQHRGALFDEHLQFRKSNDVSNDQPRVVRGGSWLYDQLRARAAFRDSAPPFSRYRYRGFRVVAAAPIR